MQLGWSCQVLRRSGTSRGRFSLTPGMMAFSTLCCKRTEAFGLRWLRAVTVALVLLVAEVYAGGIHIKSAELASADGSYTLDVNYEVTLSHTLEDALLR